MKYAVIEAPSFPLQALLRMDADLAGKPVAITEGEGRRACVAHASEQAKSSGVRIGMACVQALAECETLELHISSLPAEKEADAVLLAAAWRLTPRVEQTAPGVCTVDLTGRDMSALREEVARVRLQLHAQGLSVRVGVADSPLTARFAAWVATPEKWVADDAAFLAALPVNLLGLSQIEAELFSSLGIKTLGQIARMPIKAWTQRIGERGSILWRMATGDVMRPLNPATPPAQFAASMDLEDHIESLEPLLFVLRRFVDRLASELDAAGLVGESLRLVLRLETDTGYERSIRFPEATTRAEVLFGALENHLASVQTDAAIAGVELSIQPARPQHRQDGLFDSSLRNPHVFFDTLARTGAVLGSERVGTPVRLKNHRPDAVNLSVPLVAVPEYAPVASAPEVGPVLRRFRPAPRATVELANLPENVFSVPSFVMSERATGVIVDRRGPFHGSGDWWERDGGHFGWSREEWDVELDNGGLFRLVRLSDGWRLEGAYD